jgi:glutathione peroxidase
VVNTASTCATAAAQLPALQQLYTTYHARGLDIVAVPSNDFDKKEPLASDIELAMMYTAPDGPFQVTFPVATKSAVIGDNAHAFFARVAKKYGRSVAPTYVRHWVLGF